MLLVGCKNLQSLRRASTCKRWVAGGLVLLFVFLSGCRTLQTVPEPEIKDSGPKAPLSVNHIPIPVPRVEPRTIAGNYSPYTVLGKTYRVIKNPKGFRQRGIASWYGNKFHGRKTANGEVYDMFAVTAAHKTLPIPCFVRVTNLSNNRSIIVRVNDRGPFHSGRVIDLSYTAAKKLGVIKQGTAPVSVEYIDPVTFNASHPSILDNTQGAGQADGVKAAPTPVHAGGYQLPKGTYLQMGAFSANRSARNYQTYVNRKIGAILGNINSKRSKKDKRVAVEVVRPRQLMIYKDKLYRVQIGPLKNMFDMADIKKALALEGFKEPHTVNRFQQ